MGRTFEHGVARLEWIYQNLNAMNHTHIEEFCRVSFIANINYLIKWLKHETRTPG
jgi:hypothetical protein